MSERRLTVLQVLPALDAGGTERGVLEVAAALVAAGHRSLVVSAGGRLLRELTDGGSEHICLPVGRKSPLTLGCIPRLRRVLLRERPDVIDIHSRLPGWVTWLAWKSLPAALRPALVSTLHGLHSVSRYSGIMCCGERVIVVSETVRRYVQQNYPKCDSARVNLIHRGIDDREYPRGYRPDSEWKDGFFEQFPGALAGPVVTLAGRITRLKGHADFIRLLAGLRDRGVQAHGLIVGGQDPGRAAYAAEMEALVRELKLHDRVTFTGHRRDLKQIYAISDIVFSLSGTPESFGRTVAEALAIGTPVIGYDHGGVSEILAAQFPEGAVPLGDHRCLLERTIDILTSAKRPQPAPNVFRRDDMLRRTLEVYQEVSASRRMSATG